MRLPVIMFDFGNVICALDYVPMLERFSRRLGIPTFEIERLFHDQRARELSRQFELGRMSATNFATQVLKVGGYALPFEAFQSDWPDIFELNEPVAQLASRLKQQGYTLLLGSNTNELHVNFFRNKYREALAPFDHFAFSYQIGAMKPGREFYDACVKVVGATASSCIFIDDAPANVAGAEAAGFRGIVYDGNPAALESELVRLGVEVGGPQR